jgi:hypothetical protein
LIRRFLGLGQVLVDLFRILHHSRTVDASPGRISSARSPASLAHVAASPLYVCRRSAVGAFSASSWHSAARLRYSSTFCICCKSRSCLTSVQKRTTGGNGSPKPNCTAAPNCALSPQAVGLAE